MSAHGRGDFGEVSSREVLVSGAWSNAVFRTFFNSPLTDPYISWALVMLTEIRDVAQCVPDRPQTARVNGTVGSGFWALGPKFGLTSMKTNLSFWLTEPVSISQEHPELTYNTFSSGVLHEPLDTCRSDSGPEL